MVDTETTRLRFIQSVTLKWLGVGGGSSAFSAPGYINTAFIWGAKPSVPSSALLLYGWAMSPWPNLAARWVRRRRKKTKKVTTRAPRTMPAMLVPIIKASGRGGRSCGGGGKALFWPVLETDEVSGVFVAETALIDAEIEAIRMKVR
jgi:hypothetical protein